MTAQRHHLHLLLDVVGLRVMPLTFAAYFTALAVTLAGSSLLDAHLVRVAAIGCAVLAALFAAAPHLRVTQFALLAVGGVTLLARSTSLLLSGNWVQAAGSSVLWLSLLVMIGLAALLAERR